jgi:hypothetical protein
MNIGSSGIIVEASDILCVSARKLQTPSGQAGCVGTSWLDFNPVRTALVIAYVPAYLSILRSALPPDLRMNKVDSPMT